jgi:hypothetical protein
VRWLHLRARRGWLACGIAAVAIGAGAGGLDGWGSGRLTSRGLLDGMTDPLLHGLPIPKQFTVVAKRESPHNFDNEPTLPQSADIEVTLRAAHPVAAIRVLRAVERQLVKDWGCTYASARLGVAGYADYVDCERDGIEVEYRAADWDVSDWRRHKTDEITAGVTTPTPED